MSTLHPNPGPAKNQLRRARNSSAKRTARASGRTTITLSPQSREIVERFKYASGASTSSAIDRIIQQSEAKPSRLKEVNGFLVLDLPADSSKGPVHFTIEDMKRAEAELDREYVQRILKRDHKGKKAGVRR